MKQMNKQKTNTNEYKATLSFEFIPSKNPTKNKKTIHQTF